MINSIIFYFCFVEQSTGILLESVFAPSLTENLTVFKGKGLRTALISCIAYVSGHFLCPYIPYLFKCGVFVYFPLGFVRTFR